MRVVIVGLGIQGKKRFRSIGREVCATVDPLVVADYQDLRDVPLSDYDAACICTPDEAKNDLLLYLLRHGKHALVEKPLLGSPAEFITLEKLARRSGSACYTAYNHRFEPQISRLKGLLLRGEIGQIYSVRLVYANGTAQDVRHSSWRDCGTGVLGDLAPHLLDLTAFLLGRQPDLQMQLILPAKETIAPDSCSFALRGDPAITIEVGLLSWKNTFTIDVIGSRGSAHLEKLCKWGPSTLTVRQRIYPSGTPLEVVESIKRSDPTWAFEYRYFQCLCRARHINFSNDRWISSVMAKLMSVPQGIVV